MLDLVVFGASGFTGKLVAKYLSRAGVSGLRWGIAGRSAQKLEAVAAALAGSACPPLQILVAGCDAPDAARVAASARVVLSTAGPFSLYSDALVHACATNGACYVDINGEVPWVRRVIARDAEAARASGAVIVPNCGFDSIPSDLGAMLAVRKLGPGADLEAHVTFGGAMSGGTIATGILMSKTFPGELEQPFLLGGQPGTRFPTLADHADVSAPEPPRGDRSYWLGAFGMAPINTRVVRRSAVLHPGLEYGADFRYREYAAAPSEAVATKMTRNTRIPPEKLQGLVDAGRLFAPAQGPDEETRAKSFFELRVYDADAAGSEPLAVVAGGDPGYDETAKMVSEAALSLVVDRETLACRGAGGVWTPASGLGDPLVNRLRTAGLTIE